MKKISTTSIALLVCILGLFATKITTDYSEHKTQYGFIENKGQIHDQNNKPNPSVKYLLNTQGMNVQLREGGFSYDTYYSETPLSEADVRFCESGNDLDKIAETYQFHRIDVELVGSNKNARIETSDASEDYINYYNAVTPEEGATHVRHYKRVVYKNIYPNIDLEFLVSEDSEMKYNFIIHPGGNPNDIILSYQGGNELALTRDGNLNIGLRHGRLTESIPKSFLSETDQELIVKYIKKNNNIRFRVPKYDKTKTLVIDPTPNRTWGTYYGGVNLEYIVEINATVSGNVCIAGVTNSPTAIATAGAHQTSLVGTTNGFVAKFNSAGVIQWGTYYGGTGGVDNVFIYTVTSDLSENIFIGGMASATTGVATAGAHQTVLSGPGDAVLVKFNSSGVRQWATYYGGSGASGGEEGSSVATDAAGNVYLGGITTSTNGTSIATVGSHQVAHGGGTYDAFLVKFNTSGVRQWGTYYGGTGDEAGGNITVDTGDNVFLGGSTYSTTGIATAGTHQTALSGSNDNFYAKFNSSGVRQWGTYFGGTLAESDCILATDANNNLLVVGSTSSTAGIATAGAFKTTYTGGGFGFDGYLAKLNSSGILQWCTYLESAPAADVCTDAGGNIYVTGNVNHVHTTFATAGTYQNTTQSGGCPIFPDPDVGTCYNAFLIKFATAGTLTWGTYYGTVTTTGSSVAVDNAGAVYLGGSTKATTTIASAGAHQTAFGGGLRDGFLVQFDGGYVCSLPATPTTITGSNPMCAGGTTTYTVTAVAGATGYTWSNPAGWTLNSGQGTVTENITTNTTSGNVCVTADNVCGSSPSYCVAITVPSNGGAGTWTWTGAISTSWFNPCNWDKQALPNTLSSVLIPNTANKPLITSGTGECYIIEIQTTSGAYIMLDTSGGGILNVTQP